MNQTTEHTDPLVKIMSDACKAGEQWATGLKIGDTCLGSLPAARQAFPNHDAAQTMFIHTAFPIQERRKAVTDLQGVIIRFEGDAPTVDPLPQLAEMSSLNGMTVLVTTTDAVYLRIPPSLQRRATHGCDCDYCTKLPEDQRGYWDTLLVPFSKDRHSHASTVHMPDCRPFVDAMKAKGKFIS